jgi:uncharacterized protein YyaL (SSP411 family)
LLSVGYSACHWCHVMAHESFEDEATARLMNERFVCVKVDREERPDLDAIYMDAVVALTGQGGWPMTVFLTPEGEPFYGGTYFPPEPRHGLPSFAQVLEAVHEAWRDRREDVARAAAQLVEAVRRSSARPPSREPLHAGLLAAAEAGIRRTFEPAFGGFGRAPKFPAASTIEFLLLRGEEEMTRRTLDGMALGGLWDEVGGGFHRYAVDDRWLVPHFEKMLYDNALLAAAYLHASVALGEPRYREIAERTIVYVLRELALPEGGFASAQDADTEGVEGLTFTWTPDELAALVGRERAEQLLQPFEHGRCVIRGVLTPEERERLLAARNERPQPARDDKAVASWNGLMLAALAEAARRLERPDWLAAAVQTAEFLLGPLSPGGRLHRSYRDGRTSGPAYLDDHANVAHGLLELHVATGDPRWLHEARRLALEAVELFGDDEDGGFFLAPRDGEPLIARTKDLQDTPTPSGSSMLAHVLLRLARLWGDDELERRAVDALRLIAPALDRVPGAFAWAAVALDLHLSPPRELAIVGPVDAPVARAALARHDPRTVIAVGPDESVPLLAGKGLVDGRPAVYVCERFACRAPATDPAELA